VKVNNRWQYYLLKLIYEICINAEAHAAYVRCKESWVAQQYEEDKHNTLFTNKDIFGDLLLRDLLLY
jgi:hypothetical protein